MCNRTKNGIAALAVGALSLLLLGGATAPDYPQNQSAEEKVVQDFLLYCLPPLTSGRDAAEAAVADNLTRLSSKAADPYLNGQFGEVFALPGKVHGAVLVAQKDRVCAVMMKKANAVEVMKRVDEAFDPSTTAFEMKENYAQITGELDRTYTGRFGGEMIAVKVSAHQDPPPKGMQAVLTAMRTN